MNRIFPRTPAAPKTMTQKAHRALQPARRLHTEAELILRDIAYVLHLTQRVKASILEECEEPATAAV